MVCAAITLTGRESVCVLDYKANISKNSYKKDYYRRCSDAMSRFEFWKKPLMFSVRLSTHS